MHQEYLESRERDAAGVGHAPPPKADEGEGAITVTTAGTGADADTNANTSIVATTAGGGGGGGGGGPFELDRTVAQPPQRIIGGFAASLAVDTNGNVFTCPARGGGLQVGLGIFTHSSI